VGHVMSIQKAINLDVPVERRMAKAARVQNANPSLGVRPTITRSLSGNRLAMDGLNIWRVTFGAQSGPYGQMRNGASGREG